MMETDFSRQRINASLMPECSGKQVCLLGKVKDLDQKGFYFTLTTTDNEDIRINMSEPLSEPVAGLIEVHGQVQGNSIICENYVLFSEEASGRFDMALYNQAVDLMQRYKEFYIPRRQL